LFAPGVVEVLCNMHAKMRANVLVVPNRHHVKVAPTAASAWRTSRSARDRWSRGRPTRAGDRSVALTPAGAT
jgi:hypothetical protein